MSDVKLEGFQTMLEIEKRQFPPLPQQRTPFIGRVREIGELRHMLDDPTCRLLTLVGSGGVGKTRLALAVAETTSFADGVFFVPLQPVQTATAVLPAIADILHLQLKADDTPLHQIGRFLQNKTTLLLLDNLEQLLACADDLSNLLATAPGLKLLITSREVLNLQEEWLYPVAGLPIPDDPTDPEALEDDAVALFIERARHVRRDFAPQPELADIVKICHLVEGTPLAVELAAAWIKTLSCTDIAAEIQKNITFLETGLRNVPERHRSMRAVFEQSWQMLPAEAQQVYARLSLFRGGFQREAAQQVTGASLTMLTSFVDKSLLVWEANASTEQSRSGRYHIHELLRQYAATQIVGADLIPRQTQHSDYYMQFLHQRTADITGDLAQKATQEIHADLDNIRVAWQWAVQQGNAKAIEQAITPFAMFYQLQSKFLEASTMFALAIRRLEDDLAAQPALALLLIEMSWITIRLGQFEQAETYLHQCQAIYRQQHIKPLPGVGTDPLLGLSTLASIHGEYENAVVLAEQARQTAIAQSHLWNETTAGYLLASASYAQGDYDQAMTYAVAAQAITEQLQDRWFRAYCLIEMGKAAQALGDLVAARHHFEASYGLREALADPEGMAVSMNHLGEVAWRQGDDAEAERLYTESAAIYRKIDDRGGLAVAYHGLGQTAVSQSNFSTAQEQLHQALQIAQEIQFTPLLLTILGTIAHFLQQTDRTEKGVVLLAVVASHPATNHETKTAVQAQLQQCQTNIDPVLFNSAMQGGEQLDLETAVTIAQTYLSTPLSHAPLPPSPPASPDLLTERELEVLQLINQGLSNRQIAETLFVVLGTVKAHNNRIYSKLNANNRVQALARARELGLIS